MDADQLSQFVSSVGFPIVACAFMAWLYVQMNETLKELTRVNTEVTQRSIADFINSLNIDPTVKAQLLALTPLNYTGF